MNLRSRLLCLAVAAALLSACGNKGPLVLPDKVGKPAATASPAGTVVPDRPDRPASPAAGG